MNTTIVRGASTICMLMCALITSAQVTLDIDVAKRGAKIGERHYGIFFEEINHAGDGGLYAELISNRSFEDNASSLDNWEAIGNYTNINLHKDGLLNEAQNNALAVEISSSFLSSKGGIRNNGYWGINVVSGRTYKLSFWIKSDNGFSGTLTATLETEDGTSLGQTAIKATVTEEWQLVTAEITATGNDARGWFSLTTTTRNASFIIDMVSLFPPTYKDRPNGCRIDLAEKLEAMKPAFVRFPGGCFVEGQYENGKTNRFEWKKTIGPIEERPGHRNVNWNYNVSDGLGFHELLQLTEDLGAEPLFVVNMGMGHGWYEPYDQIEEYIDEAMDAIEYCNGDVNTEWGAKRAANGHPAPFNLKLIEIGNENYNYSSENNNDQSDHYAERYIQFYNAIKAKYPEMVIIGNVEAWGTDNPSWRNPYPVDIVDEHYYRNPAWFASKYEKYDNYNRSWPKVYVGEYAVTSDYGNTGHLRAALGEAIFMLGMENNSDVCVMNCYAPIFVNENDQKWRPDMIRFNSSESYGTPSYHVQQLFPNNVGKQNVKWAERGNEMTTGDKFGLSTWSTSATFDNVKITAADGTTLFTDDFSSNTGQWSYSNGAWNVTNGLLYQTSTTMQGAIYLCSVETGNSYTIELEATKQSGAEGFLIAFNYKDANNYCWWNLGGWNNAKHGVEMCTNGTKSTIVDTAGSLTPGRTYRLKIIVDGAAVQCYIDDELIHDFTLPVQRKVYVSSNIDEDEGMLYVKMVNPHNSDVPITINLDNATLQSGSLILMTANDSEAENTTTNQNNVYPKEETLLTGISGNTITYTAPANSLNIMRLSVADVETENNTGEAPEATIEEFKNNIQSVMSRLNYLHASMTLPATASSGASIEWNLEEGVPGYVDLIQNAYSYTLNVSKLPKGSSLDAGVLTAQVTFTDGTTATVDYPICLAPDDERYGYLYCFMNSGKEITNYALGTKEGLGKKFNVLLKGQEIFDTESIARIEGGTRDAFILRGEKPNQYLMATTDMCNAKSGIWNNYGMDLLRSTDLIHWESVTLDFRQGKQIFSDPEATTGYYNTDEEYAKINRVWAPQIIWDSDAGAYLVYYSLLSTNTGDSYDKIYYSYANEDFTTITQPRIFYDPGYSVIDADISYNPYDGLYHMYYKREAAGGNDRGIYEATSPRLVGGVWTDVAHVTNEGTAMVEGSSHIRRINEDVYNLYYMRYSEGYVYKVCETNHVGTGITSSTALLGEGSFQHGSFITLTETEYKMLEAWSDLTLLLGSCRGYYQDGTTSLDRAIDQADAALSYTTVEELATYIPVAYTNLLNVKDNYQNEIFHDLTTRKDITILLKNPDFSAGSEGWQGTPFTAANGYIAEQYNKTFDNYQTLYNMPAGKYTMSCQGFYRYGSVSNATYANAYGTEQRYAMLYINDETSPLLSIFSDQTNYTISPYTYPDNVNTANEAFNTIGTYSDNSVTFTLNEPGTLTLGIKKTTSVTNDWAIFDNFKLIYEPLDAPDPMVGTPYYLQNVATGTFLMGANSWGTRASLGQAQMDVLLESQSEGVYTINTLISNGGDNHYLGSNGYVDAAPVGWHFIDKGDGSYAITIDGTNYLGNDGTTEVNLGLTNPDSPDARWRLVTREELLRSLDKATFTQPVDATFLIRAANFNHNDTRRGEWIASGGKIDFGGDATNECAEVWNSTFIVYQQITDLPNGVYRLSMQGFYRVGGGENDGAIAAEQFANGTTQLNAYLRVNDKTLPLMSIMEEAKVVENPDYNYYNTPYGYIPQRLTGASAFFSDGCYTHELNVTVTDGTLLIAVMKEAISNHDWTCFDNFQLTYLGDKLELNETDKVFPEINGDVYPEVIVNRTITAGQWNTFVIPFDMDKPEGWEVKKLARSENREDHIILFFEDADVIETGVPYMVRVKSDIHTIKEENVKINTELANSSTDDIEFIGVYQTGKVPVGAFFICENKFYRAEDETNTIKAFRAYFTANTGTKALSYRFDGEEGTTDIGKAIEGGTVVGIYTLDGIRIHDMQEGINILQMSNGTTIKIVIE